MPEGDVVSVQVDSSTWISCGRSPWSIGPLALLGGLCKLGKKGYDRGSLADKRTEMIGSCPLIPSRSFFFLISTTISLPLMFPGTSTVTSTSPICCVHL